VCKLIDAKIPLPEPKSTYRVGHNICRRNTDITFSFLYLKNTKSQDKKAAKQLPTRKLYLKLYRLLFATPIFFQNDYSKLIDFDHLTTYNKAE